MVVRRKKFDDKKGRIQMFDELALLVLLALGGLAIAAAPYVFLGVL